jgi:hypothetical protein
MAAAVPPNPNPISFLSSDASPLNQLPKDYTPGQAQQILQEWGKGKRMIRRMDVRDLFLSARGGYPRDAKCILHTLHNIRRCNAHYIKDWQAQAAIQGMIRALSPLPRYDDDKSAAWKIYNCTLTNPTYWKARLNAALFVYRAILDDTTGLITSVSIYDVEQQLFLDTVLPAATAASESTTNITTTSSEDTEVVVQLLQDARTLTKRVYHKLLFRACKPERFLSKKQAAKYRKKVWNTTPPSPQTTHLVVQICLALGGTWEEAQVAIVDEFILFGGNILPETWSLIEEAKRKEEQQREGKEHHSQHPTIMAQDSTTISQDTTNKESQEESPINSKNDQEPLMSSEIEEPEKHT